ncbi:DUF51 family protein [Besnoitia besnoiti]|uniref:DUF51 family protein n=1 Tax=Besnoitia besnoiti TaxID=94643 RepID=A0A2A9MK93_BESBE|nr:DUF51 family protein [Besnoitia besnoiti]PFH36396.1 DUF51 family protein [Besnoitia besnoiti]
MDVSASCPSGSLSPSPACSSPGGSASQGSPGALSTASSVGSKVEGAGRTAAVDPVDRARMPREKDARGGLAALRSRSESRSSSRRNGCEPKSADGDSEAGARDDADAAEPERGNDSKQASGAPGTCAAAWRFFRLRADVFISSVADGAGGLHADEAMCAWAFDILIAHLEGREPRPEPPASVQSLSARGVSCPAFVTWMKRRKGSCFSRREADLRGCIGSLSPIPILDVGDYVLTSALRDRRFKPISLKEVPQLKCHVSLLHSYETAATALDWDVGVHGTTISFCGERGEKYSATYLPEIAKEMGMTQREAIASLVKKAGYPGALTDDLLERISLTRYQSSQARLDYDTYMEKYNSNSRRRSARDEAAH